MLRLSTVALTGKQPKNNIIVSHKWLKHVDPSSVLNCRRKGTFSTLISNRLKFQNSTYWIYSSYTILHSSISLFCWCYSSNFRSSFGSFIGMSFASLSHKVKFCTGGIFSLSLILILGKTCSTLVKPRVF